MQTLLSQTTAYKILTGDVRSERASHAYLLYFSDAANLREAVKYFAVALYGAKPCSREQKLIEGESFSDVKIFPAEGKKLSVADADEISSDCALKPIEGSKKIYAITSFEEASAVVQNKLLKVLEEPPSGVHFLLGATSLSPVLQTIISRVRLLEIQPFSPEQIASALVRSGCDGKRAKIAAESCGGILGQAQAMASGAWFDEVLQAAEEICRADTMAKAGDICLKYGDTSHREDLLRQVQRIYFSRLTDCVKRGKKSDGAFCLSALSLAVSSVDGALSDLKFNANFSNLLYDFALKVITENNRWKKLSE